MICPGCLRTIERSGCCPWCFAQEVRQNAGENRYSGDYRGYRESRREEQGRSQGMKEIRKKLLPPGTVLHERYRLGRWLGHGGFGIMYRAMDEHLQRVVAVKEFFPWRYTMRGPDGRQLILPQEEKTEELQILRAHFLEEARIQAMASEVSEVPDVYEVFEENHSAYLVMEYVDGMLLSNWMRQCGRMQERLAAAVILQLLEALVKLHERGIVHGDLGPDNLVLTGKQRLKLLDFGSARRIENPVRPQVTGGSHDNPDLPVTVKAGFAPPEQYHRESKADVRMDIYAAGALFSYLLTGIRPDSPLVRRKKQEKKQKEKKGWTRESRKEPYRFREICQKAMALDPGMRYGSAAEMKAAAEAVLCH